MLPLQCSAGSRLVKMNIEYIPKSTKLYLYGNCLHLKKTPIATINKQLIMIKAKPQRIVRVNATGDIDDLFSLYCRFKKPNPVPTRRLKLGPAKHP